MSQNLNIWDVFWLNQVHRKQKVVSGRRVAGAIRCLANPRDLQLSVLVLHEILLLPVLMYGSETMLWKEEISIIMAVQMDNIRGLLGIRRMDRVPNARKRELCGMKKGLNERIDEGVLRWFGHVETMESYMIAKKVHVGECACSRSVGRPWKRWIDTVKDCLKKREFWMSSKQGEWCMIRVNTEGL